MRNKRVKGINLHSFIFFFKYRLIIYYINILHNNDLANVNESLNSNLSVKLVSATAPNTAVNAGGYATVHIPLNIPNGYVPVAIKEVDSGNTLITFESILINQDRVLARVHNNHSVMKEAKLQCTVMCMVADIVS